MLACLLLNGKYVKKKNEVGFVCVTLFSCEFFQDSQEYGVSPVSTCTSFIKFKEFEI